MPLNYMIRPESAHTHTHTHTHRVMKIALIHTHALTRTLTHALACVDLHTCSERA